jgi:2-polyprenyl-3-methyl-5-hydroxy-6-metoxy-1,4-benzoquinol methylase
MRGHVDDAFDVREKFDKIYCLEVIEHIYREQGARLLENISRVLKPGGMVFLTTPNYLSLWPVIELLMDKLGLAPQMEGEQHVTKYTPRSFRALISENKGFELVRLQSCYLLAPWLAPLGQGLATRVNTFELEHSNALGCLLVAVLRKR